MKVNIGVCGRAKSDRQKEDKMQDRINHGKMKNKHDTRDDKEVPIILERFGNIDVDFVRFTGREAHNICNSYACLPQLERITIADAVHRNLSVRATKFVLGDETSGPQRIPVHVQNVKIFMGTIWLGGGSVSDLGVLVKIKLLSLLSMYGHTRKQ